MSNINKKKDERKRFLSWTCVVYPGDSLPNNWKEVLGELMTPWAISPLHDKDLNADGTPKKPHRHLLLAFHSVKSYEQVKEITDKLGAPSPQPCREIRGLVRYFCHLDNPEKAQYSREGIESGCGFDLENALKPTATEEYEVLAEIEQFCEDNWICEYADLAAYVRNDKKEWRSVFMHYAFHLGQIIKSQRNRKERENLQVNQR